MELAPCNTRDPPTPSEEDLCQGADDSRLTRIHGHALATRPHTTAERRLGKNDRGPIEMRLRMKWLSIVPAPPFDSLRCPPTPTSDTWTHVPHGFRDSLIGSRQKDATNNKEAPKGFEGLLRRVFLDADVAYRMMKAFSLRVLSGGIGSRINQGALEGEPYFFNHGKSNRPSRPRLICFWNAPRCLL